MADEKRLIDAIEQEMPYCPETQYEIGYQNGLSMAKAIAIKLGAVEAVHGRRDVEVGMNYNKERICPVCNKHIESNYWNYCPNCGAKMDLEVPK